MKKLIIISFIFICLFILYYFNPFIDLINSRLPNGGLSENTQHTIYYFIVVILLNIVIYLLVNAYENKFDIYKRINSLKLSTNKLIVILVFTALVILIIKYIVFNNKILTADEWEYIFQGKIFSSGKLVLETPEKYFTYLKNSYFQYRANYLYTIVAHFLPLT